MHALAYSASLMLLMVNALVIMSHLNTGHYATQYIASGFKALFVCGSGVVMVNLWMNAFFIQSRIEGSPIMQVTLPEKPSYCSYKYVFYKISADGTVHYLCPDHYGLFPATGKLPAGTTTG